MLVVTILEMESVEVHKDAERYAIETDIYCALT